MKTQYIFFWILKAGIAALIAFLLLNSLSYGYYYIPYNIECKSGATDFTLPANFSGVNGVEGYAKIQLDENGYNNQMVPEKINVLSMGSSHTLAYNVNPGQGYSAILNQDLYNRKGWNVYNIGMFGHEWYYCMDNLEAALETFHPTDYVIVESFYSKFELEKLKKLNMGNYNDAGQVTSKTMQHIKKFPYLQLLGHQLKNMLSQSDNVEDNTSKDINTQIEIKISEEYKRELEVTFQHAYKAISKQGCRLIFLYHMEILVNQNGNAYTNTNNEYRDFFKQLCEKYNFIFVDMTETFLEAYRTLHILPRGFKNTKIGYGHLNQYGHELIAKELYRTIINN